MEIIDRNATLTEMKNQIEIMENAKPPRQYLGMSQIGDECERSLWYDFRKVAKREFSANVLLKFQDGFQQEDIAIKRLSFVPGVELLTRDSKGQQFGYKLINGHFSGHCDGHILGIYEAPKTWHIWEHKSSEKMDDLNNAIEKFGYKNALENWNFTYYAQAQIYMHCQGFTRHFLTCSSSGGRDYTSIRTDYKKDVAINIIDKADRIIRSEKPLNKLSEKPEFFKCKWCNQKNICHFNAVPQVNCRTCCFSEPDTTSGDNQGNWFCHRLERNVNFDEQLKGCDKHLFLNTLMPFEAVDIDQTQKIPNWIKYKKDDYEFYNVNILSVNLLTKDAIRYSSKEIFNLGEFNKIFNTSEQVKKAFKGAETPAVKAWEKCKDLKGLQDIL